MPKNTINMKYPKHLNKKKYKSKPIWNFYPFREVDKCSEYNQPNANGNFHRYRRVPIRLLNVHSAMLKARIMFFISCHSSRIWQFTRRSILRVASVCHFQSPSLKRWPLRHPIVPKLLLKGCSVCLHTLPTHDRKMSGFGSDAALDVIQCGWLPRWPPNLHNAGEVQFENFFTEGRANLTAIAANRRPADQISCQDGS